MTNKTKTQIIALLRTDTVTDRTGARLPDQDWRSTSLAYSTRLHDACAHQHRYASRGSKWF
jgi:hypothetical protein